MGYCQDPAGRVGQGHLSFKLYLLKSWMTSHLSDLGLKIKVRGEVFLKILWMQLVEEQGDVGMNFEIHTIAASICF